MSYNPRIAELERNSVSHSESISDLTSKTNFLLHVEDLVTYSASVSYNSSKSIAATETWIKRVRNDYTKGLAAGYSKKQIISMIASRLRTSLNITPVADMTVSDTAISVSYHGFVQLAVGGSGTPLYCTRTMSITFGTSAITLAAPTWTSAGSGNSISGSEVAYPINSGNDVIKLEYLPIYPSGS